MAFWTVRVFGFVGLRFGDSSAVAQESGALFCGNARARSARDNGPLLFNWRS